MSYDPTERASQPPDQQPAQPPVTPPGYGQPAQPQQPQYPGVPPTVYGGPQQQQPAMPSNPSYPAYGQQPAMPSYGAPSSPSYPAYGQQPQQPAAPSYGAPSSPSYPAYGQQQPPSVPSYGAPSSPSYPAYGQQPQQPAMPSYGAPSNPSYPAYGQQPQQPAAPSYGAPMDPYAQQQQQPGWGAAAPPMYVPQAAPPKKGGGAKLLIIIVVIVVVLAGGGGGAFAWYQATRPKPVISITSQYLDGATLVGATSTSFTLKGTDFTANSAISFLFDGGSLLGAPSVTSDSKGGVDATLTVGGSWSVGMHTITAKDASGYATNLGVKVEIVNQGQDKTPGPNGAPTDSANMKIIAIVLAGSSSVTDNLTVTGSANGGTVCGDIDDGKPHTYNGTASGVGYVGTIVYSCSGTYKSGKLDYTETVTSYKVAFDNGVNCTAGVPFTSQHLTGTFSDATAAGGNYTEDSFTITCGTQSSNTTANSGTWTGVASIS